VAIWGDFTGDENRLKEDLAKIVEEGAKIRSRTGNAKTLDDVMRLLYENHALPKPGFADAELKAAFEKVAGGDLTDLFDRYVYVIEEIDFDRRLGLAGLQMTGEYQAAQVAAIRPFDNYSIKPVKEMNPEQRAIRQSWLREQVK
jgi:predicted metalloprotease with PDZ domain